jgi:hypothetical protein
MLCSAKVRLDRQSATVWVKAVGEAPLRLMGSSPKRCMSVYIS